MFYSLQVKCTLALSACLCLAISYHYKNCFFGSLWCRKAGPKNVRTWLPFRKNRDSTFWKGNELSRLVKKGQWSLVPSVALRKKLVASWILGYHLGACSDLWSQRRKPNTARLLPYGEELSSLSFTLSWTPSPGLPRKWIAKVLHNKSVTPGTICLCDPRVTLVRHSVCEH